jgi:hypothetical protein
MPDQEAGRRIADPPPAIDLRCTSDVQGIYLARRGGGCAQPHAPQARPIGRLAHRRPGKHCHTFPQGLSTSLEGVLRLLDARTGSPAEVRPARPGVLRVCAHVQQDEAGSGISALRVLLVADLLARTAELTGLQVLTTLEISGPPVDQAAALESDANALGIHPPTARTSAHDAPSPLGGPIDVHLLSQGASLDQGQGGLVVSVGAAHLGGTDSRADAPAGRLPAGQGHDPLAVRLALMSFPSHQPADLADDGLSGARETLASWRQQVAGWAESPSQPMPVHIADAASAAFNDLDTVSALALLRGLAPDASVPAGAKFETFVYADRILGLDLARDIGH